MKKFILIIICLLFTRSLHAEVIERVVIDFSDNPDQMGTLRMTLFGACNDPGDDLILFDGIDQTEIRIMLTKPLAIPAICNGKVKIQDYPGVPTILDGSNMTGGTEPGETCELGVDTDKNVITGMVFVGNKVGAGLCLFGNENQAINNQFGEEVNGGFHPNRYGIVVSDVFEQENPQSKAKANLIVDNKFFPQHDYGIWLEAPETVIENHVIPNPKVAGIMGKSTGGFLLNNKVTDSEGQGILLIGDKNTLEDNEVTHAQGFGIWLEGLSQVLTNNTVLESGQEGISLVKANGSKLEGNQSDQNKNHGLYLSGSSGPEIEVVANSFSHNEGEGVLADGEDFVFRGNTVVENQHNGMVLYGNSHHILDNNVVSHNQERGIFIHGNELLMEETTIEQNGQTGFQGEGRALDLRTSLIRDNGQSGVFITGDNAALLHNEVVDNEQYGVAIFGNTAQVGNPLDNPLFDTPQQIERNGTTGLYIEGDNATVANNDVLKHGQGGIHIMGEEANVLNNTIKETVTDALYVQKMGGVINGNKVEESRAHGIVLFQGDHETRGNVVTHVALTGIYAEGNQETIVGNSVSDAEKGIYVYGDYAGIDRNFVMGVRDNGIARVGSGGGISNNKTTDCGANGIFVKGDLVSVAHNEVTQSHHNGIAVETNHPPLIANGNFTSITGNQITESAQNGFFVFGERLLLSENFVKGSGQHAARVKGKKLKIADNKLVGNNQSGVFFEGSQTEIVTNRVFGNKETGVVALQQMESVGRGGNSMTTPTSNDKIIVKANTIENNGGHGLYSKGEWTQVSSNSIHENKGKGIYHEGGNVRVEDNPIKANQDVGIHLVGDGGEVDSNTVAKNQGRGIYVQAAAAGGIKVSHNTVSSNQGEGLFGIGPNLTFFHNTVTDNQKYGFYLEGDQAKVHHNQLTANNGYGAVIYGQQEQILSNVIAKNTEGGLHSKGFKLVVVSNQISENAKIGLSLHGDEISAALNQSLNNQGDGLWLVGNKANVTENILDGNAGYGMNLDGDQIQVTTNNKMDNNAKAGLQLWGVDCVIGIPDITTPFKKAGGNTIEANGEEGIRVQGNGCHFTGNHVRKNEGIGIYVSGDATQLTQNEVEQNHKEGLYLMGNEIVVDANHVYSNSAHGVLIEGEQAKLVANEILANGGCPEAKLLDSQTLDCLENGQGGVGLLITAASHNFVVGGDDFDKDHNVVRYNRDGGVVVLGNEKNDGHQITKNIISRNYSVGPSLDLGNNGYTLNDLDDSDEGPNHLLNYIDYLQSFPLVDSPEGKKRYWSWGIAKFGTEVELFGVAEEDVAREITHGGGDDYFGEGAISGWTFQVPPHEHFNYEKLGWVTLISFDESANTSEYSVNVVAGADQDLDGIVDSFEKGIDDKASNLDSTDTDGDGLPDSVEDRNRNGVCEPELNETCAFEFDTDLDGISDGHETHGDGVYDVGVDANPWLPDTDGDGLTDGEEDKNKNGIWEYHVGETSPLRIDSDADGFADHASKKQDTCPNMANPAQEPWYCSL